jgi:O-antigen/teichoic acid export membrane protein
VGRAVVAVGVVGALILAGAWLFGGLGMRLLYGPDFEIDRSVLVLLGTLTAFYLLGEVLNQALFARGLARLAALGWLVGLSASLASFALLRMGVLERVSLALALGAAVAVMAQTALYLAARRPDPERLGG